MFSQTDAFSDIQAASTMKTGFFSFLGTLPHRRSTKFKKSGTISKLGMLCLGEFGNGGERDVN